MTFLCQIGGSKWCFVKFWSKYDVFQLKIVTFSIEKSPPPLNQAHVAFPPTHFLFYFLKLFIKIILKSVTQYLRMFFTFGNEKNYIKFIHMVGQGKIGMKITKPGKLQKWKIATATKNHNLWVNVLLLLAQNKLPIHIMNRKRGRDLADFSQFFALWRIWQLSIFC